MDLQLKGKAAFITGGSMGIGKAAALELAREGVDVAIAARRLPILEEAAAELHGALADVPGAGRVLPVVVDTTDMASLTTCPTSALSAVTMPSNGASKVV